MALGMHITRSRNRRFRCDVSGCRNFTTIFVTRRGDISGRPLHLCEDCIKTAYALLEAEQSPAIPEVEEPVTEVDVELPVVPEKAKTEPKKEAKPNKAQGGKSAPKGGKK